MPRSSTLTMACLPILELDVQFVLPPGFSGRGSNYGDLASLVDFDSRDTQTGRADGFDRSGHVLLPKCGRCARHLQLPTTSSIACSLPRLVSCLYQAASHCG